MTRPWKPPVGTTPSSTTRSWSYRDALAYLRGLVAEGVRLEAHDERLLTLRAWIDEAFKAATHRERQDASLLFRQLVSFNVPSSSPLGGGQPPSHPTLTSESENDDAGPLPSTPQSIPMVMSQGASATPSNVATRYRTPPQHAAPATTAVHRPFVDYTQRHLTAAQAERELLPIIYEGGWFAHLAHMTKAAQAPPAYFFGAALTIAGAAFAARPRILWEQSPLYTNLYTVLVGESGTGKSTAVEWVQSIMQPALGNHLLGNDGTPQGFMRGLHERWSFTRLCADGLIVADEYKNLIGREKHKEQLVSFLTAVYGKHGAYDRVLGNADDTGKYYFENPRVSIIAGTTMEWWRNSHEDAVLGGYVPRHFIFESAADDWTSDMNAGNTGGHAQHNGAGHPLTAMLADIIISLPGEIALSPDAWAYVNYWRNEVVRRVYEVETDKEVRGWLRRKPTGVLKVATICHLINRHTGPVCVACAHWARRVVDWQDYGVRRVYADLSKNRLARLTKKIVEIVERADGGATTGVIRERLRHAIKRKEVEEICGDLSKEGVIYGTLDMGNDTIWRVR